MTPKGDQHYFYFCSRDFHFFDPLQLKVKTIPQMAQKLVKKLSENISECVLICSQISQTFFTVKVHCETAKIECADFFCVVLK